MKQDVWNCGNAWYSQVRHIQEYRLLLASAQSVHAQAVSV